MYECIIIHTCFFIWRTHLVYKQKSSIPINKNVKDIIYNNKISYNNWRYKSDRDYSNFDFNKFYANKL